MDTGSGLEIPQTTQDICFLDLNPLLPLQTSFFVTAACFRQIILMLPRGSCFASAWKVLLGVWKISKFHSFLEPTFAQHERFNHIFCAHPVAGRRRT